jgi:receptor protein-tyrosine kinase
MHTELPARILGTQWFHKRFTLTPQGRYVSVTELAEWARGPYDELRKNLFLQNDGTGKTPRVVMLAAARHGDGTTTTAVLLAASQAAKDRCLLLELNFRWPGVADSLGLNGAPGLGALLEDPANAELDAAILPTPVHNLFALPIGSKTAKRALPDVTALRTILERLRPRFDYIVIDAAPLLLYPDTALLAPLADAVLLVVAADSTPVQQCVTARREIERAKAYVAGTVVTRQRQFVPEPLARRLVGSGQR